MNSAARIRRLALVLAASAARLLAAPPSTGWREVVPADEAERFVSYLQDVKDLQDRNAAKNDGKIMRGFHAKLHAGVHAKLVVGADVPAAARYGVFAKPGSYDAIVRYSNGLGVVQSDLTPDVRGMAVKVLGAPGPALLSDPDHGSVQDLVTINHPYLPIRDIEQLVALLRASAHPATLVLKLPRILGVTGAGRALRFVATRMRKKTGSLLAEQYCTVVPMKFGPYAGKLGFVPKVTAEPGGEGPGYLSADLAARLGSGEQRFDVVVQFFTDEATTPIEDGSLEWDVQVSPWVKVAELVLPRQDLKAPEARAFSTAVDRLRFNPWHCHADLRPLGSLMRARKALYEASADYRQAAGN